MAKLNQLTFACLMLFATTAWAVTPTTKLIADAQGANNAKSTAKPNAKPTTKATPKARANNKAAAVDANLEKTAISLVDTHLPALKKVLVQLKNDSPRQYSLAIRDLVKSARKLEYAKNRDEELYEIEVELLKAKSSIKLLTAKLKVRDNDADRETLRKTAQRLHNAELAKANYNVRMMSERLKKAELALNAAKKRLDSMENVSESRLEKNYTTLLQQAGRRPAKKATGNKSKNPK